MIEVKKRKETVSERVRRVLQIIAMAWRQCLSDSVRKFDILSTMVRVGCSGFAYMEMKRQEALREAKEAADAQIKRHLQECEEVEGEEQRRQVRPL